MAKRESKLDRAAVSIGTALGHVMGRMDRWRSQRDEIASELHHVVKTGQKMLAELGHTASAEGAAMRRGGKAGANKVYKMSAAARRKMSLAAKRRHAARRAADAGKSK